MQRCKDQLRSRIILEMLGLAEAGLSPAEFRRNFGADEGRVRVAFEELRSAQLVRRVGGDTYRLTPQGEDEVLRRGQRVTAD